MHTLHRVSILHQALSNCACTSEGGLQQSSCATKLDQEADLTSPLTCSHRAWSWETLALMRPHEASRACRPLPLRTRSLPLKSHSWR